MKAAKPVMMGISKKFKTSPAMHKRMEVANPKAPSFPGAEVQDLRHSSTDGIPQSHQNEVVEGGVVLEGNRWAGAGRRKQRHMGGIEGQVQAVERHPPWQNFLQIWPETKATWLEAIAGAAAKISKRSGTLCPENWHQPAARRSRRSPPQLECKLLNTHSRALHIPQEALSLAGYCARQTPRALPWWRRSWFSYPRRWWCSGRYPQRDQWQFLPAYIAGKPPTGPSCPHPTRRWWEWARLQTWWHRPSTLCHLVVRRPAKKSARFAWEVLRVETRLSRFEMPLLHLEVSPASSSRRARGCHSSPHNLGTWSWKPATKFALVEVPQGFPDFPDFPPANWRHVLPLPLVGIPTRSFHGLLHPGSALWQRRYVNPAAGWQLGGNGSGKMGQLVLWFTVTVGRMLTTHPN